MKKGLIVAPWDPEYDCQEIVADVDVLEKSILPVGTPFSRLWRSGGIWRPVRY